jgi:hypothetical protein
VRPCDLNPAFRCRDDKKEKPHCHESLTTLTCKKREGGWSGTVSPRQEFGHLSSKQQDLRRHRFVNLVVEKVYSSHRIPHSQPRSRGYRRHRLWYALGLFIVMTPSAKYRSPCTSVPVYFLIPPPSTAGRRCCPANTPVTLSAAASNALWINILQNVHTQQVSSRIACV